MGGFGGHSAILGQVRSWLWRALLAAVWLVGAALPFLLKANVVVIVIYLSIFTAVSLAIAILMLVNSIARREQADLTGGPDGEL